MRWLIIFATVVLISGCISVPGEEEKEIKKEVEEDSSEELNTQIQKLEEEKESLKTQIDSLKKEIEELKKGDSEIVEDEIVEEKTESKGIDLSSWKRDDVITAMGKYNSRFVNATWFTYIYREDKHYYDQVGPIYDEDPFYRMRYKDRGDELKVNSLRVFNLAPGNRTKALTEYENNYLPSIDKELIIDENLKCEKKEECDMKIVECSKERHKYYSWFAAPYLFVTRDDKGESLETFKLFYCG